jgi:outer membrane protein assembly factor BamB
MKSGWIFLIILLYFSSVFSQEIDSWYMVAANPQRTSWIPESVPSTEYLQQNREQHNNGMLYPEWFKPIEPYIPPKVQIITAYDTLYISTAKGLYAIDSSTGSERWVYPTEMPLGNSPTIHDGVAYVGGFDHKIHAIEANPDITSLSIDPNTGYRINDKVLWTYESGVDLGILGAGFDTNPLVIDNTIDSNIPVGEGKLYAGNRDGNMYAIYIEGPKMGELAWNYTTDGQIHFSAAYKQDVIYFASNDAQAYALNATNGDLIWKSENLPTYGFHSWWPVIYEDPESGADVVIFSGGYLYRSGLLPRRTTDLHHLEWRDIFPVEDPNDPGDDAYTGSYRSPITDDGWIDTSQNTYFGSDPVTTNSDYFEEKPWRRTYFVLDRQTGQEITYDFDNDGKSEYAPILWFGTHDGNRYPPIIGSDNMLYQSNMYTYRGWIQGGQVSAWDIGTPNIRVSTPHTIAMDEPLAYSAAGNLIYWTHCCDRAAGAFDITVSINTTSHSRTWAWLYFNYNLGYDNFGQSAIVPGYDMMFTEPFRPGDWPGVYGNMNGVYSGHVGDQNPPIPYQDKVYIHRSNSIIAFSRNATSVAGLPLASTKETTNAQVTPPDVQTLKLKLEDEIEEIINAGHLKPGWGKAGLFEGSSWSRCGENLMDYWHNPSDTLYTLSISLNHLPEDLQEEVKKYMNQEFMDYPPYDYSHLGWRDGSYRDSFGMPPEDESSADGPSSMYGDFWGDSSGQRNYPPHMFYSMWKYALNTDNPQQIAQYILANSTYYNGNSKLLDPPYQSFEQFPFVLNSHIAGRIGYLELQKLAGQQESADIRTELEDLLDLRVTTFSKDTFYNHTKGSTDMYCQTLSVARNFMFMVPELAEYLYENAYNKVEEAVDEYSWIAPYWFVGKFEATTGEGTFKPYYDSIALFQAKALILKEPYEELFKYLDAPVFDRGDLFYIQNLVTLIDISEEQPSTTTTQVTTTTTPPIATITTTTLPRQESPQWFNIRHSPVIVLINQAVQIIVDWWDDTEIRTVIISENSSGIWVNHTVYSVGASTSTLATTTSTTTTTSITTTTNGGGGGGATTTLSTTTTLPGPGPAITGLNVETLGSIGKYDKFEVSFDVDTVAANPYFPYDSSPPPGVDSGIGITVDMLILEPGESNWGNAKNLPCFYYQPVEEVGSGSNIALLPVGEPEWRCRFTPEEVGNWEYKIRATDAGGTSESSIYQFTSVESDNKGFIKASQTDTRFFEFSDGTPFVTPMINTDSGVGGIFNGLTTLRTNIQKLGTNGFHFIRWFFGGEGSNYYFNFYGGRMHKAWAHGPGVSIRFNNPDQPYSRLSFRPYYHTGQSLPVYSSTDYRLTFRAMVSENNVLRIVTSGSNIQQVQVDGVNIGPPGGDFIDICSITNDYHDGNINGDVCHVQQDGWHDYQIDVAPTGNSMHLYLRGLYVTGNEDLPSTYDPYNNVLDGTIGIHSINLRRDETGNGGWGPNLLHRSHPETHLYVDQISSARFDEMLRLCEQYEVYQRLTLFDKNDWVLNRIQLQDGNCTEETPPHRPQPSSYCIQTVNEGDFCLCPRDYAKNFYSADGKASRWYQRAYTRYFIARWSYSPSIHSLELANENNYNNWNDYGERRSFEAAYSLADYVNRTSPRHILMSNSFSGWFIASESNDNLKFWNYDDIQSQPIYPYPESLMDNCDRHQYAREGTNGQPPTDSTKSHLWNDSAAYVHECNLQFDNYNSVYDLNKPIIRGEGGVQSESNPNPMSCHPDLALDSEGIWFHKKVWAHTGILGYNCDGDWYASFLMGDNVFKMYKAYENFTQGEPLNNGNYQEIGTDFTGDQQIFLSGDTGNLRAWGSRDSLNGRVLLWIDNSDHTWINVVDGVNIPSAGGDLTIQGLPQGTYQAEWWDTRTGIPKSTENYNVGSNGQLTFSVNNLDSDVAVKFDLV